jgi:glycosyltransferase involved in cell wall biosynthesis
VKLSVIIPVYNEKDTISEIVSRVGAAPFDKEIVIVDDCSIDGTRAILAELEREPGIRVFLQPENRGKGAALRTGFAHVSGDIVLIQDADLEYDPSDYGALLEPILSGKADVVFGSRFLGGPRRVLYFWHSVANRLLTLFSDMMTNLNLTDMETCYKVFRREVIERITITSNRFGVEPELTQKVARLGVRIYEVPVSYHGRSYSEGKKIGWKDAVSALYHILKYKLVT